MASFETFGGDMLRTAAGYEIKVKESGITCIVYLGNTPEVVRVSGGSEVMEQEIPHVAFVGEGTSVDYPSGQLTLIPILSKRIRLEYRMSGESKSQSINIQCNSRSDQFPVRVKSYPSVRDYVMGERGKYQYKFIAVDEGVGRVDLVKLKAGQPNARILILKGKLASQAMTTAQKLSKENVRAIDMAPDAGQAKNPVFLARLHLRNLAIPKVANLLIDFKISPEEASFIETFLKIMIRNESNKPELTAVHSELLQLQDLYILGGLILAGDRVGFYKALEQGIDKSIYGRLQALVGSRRDGSEGKVEEIYYWEWQYRLKQSQF